MLSMPPATITRAEPARIESAPLMRVCIPDPHILFIVTAGTDSGSPAASAACRAGACP